MLEKQGMSVSTACQVQLLMVHSRFNTTLTSLRRTNLDGIYDSHTNLMFYPKIMQPSHVKWEHIPTPSQHLAMQQQQQQAQQKTLTNGDHPHLTNGDLPNGTSHTVSTPDSDPTIFASVPAVVSRNFLVADTVFVSPPVSNLGVPGPDGDIDDVGPNGLSGVPQAVLDELPADCKAAFEEARQRELGWKKNWSGELQDGSRGTLRIGFNGFPV